MIRAENSTRHVVFSPATEGRRPRRFASYLIVSLKVSLPLLPASSVAVPRSVSLILPFFCLIAVLTSRFDF